MFILQALVFAIYYSGGFIEIPLYFFVYWWELWMNALGLGSGFKV
jgi:hypothetical protein